MKVDISVVIPIFGEVHTERLLAVVDSMLLQTGVSVEVIVSEQTLGKGLFLQGRFPDVIHLVSRPQVVDGKAVYSASIARNIGMKKASGEYIYFNDADIVFLKPSFLHGLYEEIQPVEVLIRPAMWRMLKEEVPRFLAIRKHDGLKAALSQIVFSKNYLATFPDSGAHVELIEFKQRTFSAPAEDLEKYRDDVSLHGLENILWQRIVHCGGTFGKKRDIESVGGYSSLYPSMYEDSDLQWKLRERFTVREIHEDGVHAVLHLDHELPYRSYSKEMHDKDTFEQRKSIGVARAIEDDIARLNLFDIVGI